MTLRDGIETRRYWRSLLQVQAERALPLGKEGRANISREMREEMKPLLATLRRDGVAIIENYWSAEKCTTARNEIDRLISAYPEHVHLCSGGADRRMFGVEMVSDFLLQFHEDDFLRSIGEILGVGKLYNFATLGARIDATEANNGSGGGWHRDAFGFQYKAIIYLGDVSIQNGPFEYLLGSHLLWRAVRDTALGRLPPPPQSRVDNAALEPLLAKGIFKSRRFTARAGTVILANTSGLHRGMPLREERRYALTNYYYNHFQVGASMIEKFKPMMPGTIDRLLSVIETQKVET